MQALDRDGQLDSTGIVRALPGVMVAEGWSERRSSRVLSPHGRYYVIPRPALEFLRDLDTRTLGMAVGDARDLYPQVLIEKLVEFRLVDWIPPEGLQPSWVLVRELWLANLRSRALLRRKGWQVIAERLSPPVVTEPKGPRPVLLDEIETAARVSYGLPGTNRRCTVVALAVESALRSHRVPSRLEIVTTPEQVLFHVYVRAGGHIVDPGDTLVEGLKMRPLPTF